MNTFKKRFQQWQADRQARRITSEAAWERAARGADYLDEVDPGWYRRVDAGTMELAHAACCVLGQLHGDFRAGLSRSRLLSMGSAPRANLSPVHFGFLCEQGVGVALQEADYENLNRAWQGEVWRRQDLDVRPAEEPVAPDVRPDEEAAAAEVAESFEYA